MSHPIVRRLWCFLPSSTTSTSVGLVAWRTGAPGHNSVGGPLLQNGWPNSYHLLPHSGGQPQGALMAGDLLQHGCCTGEGASMLDILHYTLGQTVWLGAGSVEDRGVSLTPRLSSRRGCQAAVSCSALPLTLFHLHMVRFNWDCQVAQGGLAFCLSLFLCLDRVEWGWIAWLVSME